VIDPLLHVEKVTAADQLVDAANADPRHQLAQFLGNKEEVVDDVLGLAGKPASQHRILRGNTHRTGIEMALAHHDAAFDNQRRGGETKLVGTQQRTDQHVAPGFHLAIDLHPHATTQAIEHQRLLRLGQTQFPGRASVLDRRLRAGSCSSVVTGNHQMIRLGLGDSGSDRADTDLGYQLDTDRRLGIGVLEVVDELRQVFDRVDVVVRRRRNEPDARHRVAQKTDVFGNLVAWKLTPFSRLGALRHLDLELVGIDQILGGDPETSGGDLLDRRAQAVAGL
jgi:hypothetical protein